MMAVRQAVLTHSKADPGKLDPETFHRWFNYLTAAEKLHPYLKAWDALMAVPLELRQEHARTWRSSVRRLRRVCRRIERNMETISLADLHTALDEARSIPAALARALNVEAPKLPRSVLRLFARVRAAKSSHHRSLHSDRSQCLRSAGMRLEAQVLGRQP